jgi:uncharacterized SAM-binding protein YcdF (DUF218 family)
MSDTEIDRLAKIIWDYHHVGHELKKADAIFVLGSHDVRVGEYAVDLYFQGLAPFIIFSGGLGKLTIDHFNRPEAEIFADIAIKRGVPADKILVENKSGNTGENVLFVKKLLQEKRLDFQSFILVQKPYMERRTFATFKKLWPEKNFIVTSPPISFEDYPNEEISKAEFINIMVGDLQRIKIYPDLGYQISQEIPDDVWRAYEALIAAGYTGHLVVS